MDTLTELFELHALQKKLASMKEDQDVLELKLARLTEACDVYRADAERDQNIIENLRHDLARAKSGIPPVEIELAIVEGVNQYEHAVGDRVSDNLISSIADEVLALVSKYSPKVEK